MRTTKITLEQAIEEVENGEMVSSYPLFMVQVSLEEDRTEKIYTASDVVDLLKSIQGEAITQEKIGELCDYVGDAIDNMNEDELVELDSANFELHGNEISLESVEVDRYQIRKCIKESIKNYFRE